MFDWALKTDLVTHQTEQVFAYRYVQKAQQNRSRNNIYDVTLKYLFFNSKELTGFCVMGEPFITKYLRYYNMAWKIFLDQDLFVI